MRYPTLAPLRPGTAGYFADPESPGPTAHPRSHSLMLLMSTKDPAKDLSKDRSGLTVTLALVHLA